VKIDLSLHELMLLRQILLEQYHRSSRPVSENKFLDGEDAPLPFETIPIPPLTRESLTRKITGAMKKLNAESNS
jgi:hypothetical protein